MKGIGIIFSDLGNQKSAHLTERVGNGLRSETTENVHQMYG